MPMRANSGGAGGTGDSSVTTRASEVRYGDWKFQQLVSDIYPRCWRCDRLLGEEFTRPWRKKCLRCQAMNSSPPPEGHTV